MKRYILLAAGILFLRMPLWAGTGTTALSFLQENLNARLVGMAGAFSAAAQGSEGILTNPAGVARPSLPEVNASHGAFQDQSHQTQILYSHPFQFSNGRKISVGGALNYFTAGKIDIFDSNGTLTASKKAEESYAAGFCLSAEVFSFLSLGVTPKYISSKLLDQYLVSAFAADVGGMVFPLPRYKDRLVLGAALQNVGSSVKYKDEQSNMPRTIALGLSGIPWEDDSRGSLLLTVQGEQILRDKITYRLGGEYSFGRKGARAFFLRGGTHLQSSESFSIGIGAREKRFSLDYAFVSVGDLEKTHRLTLVFRLGSPVWQEEKEETLVHVEEEKREPSREVLFEDDERRKKFRKSINKNAKDDSEYYLLKEK